MKTVLVDGVRAAFVESGAGTPIIFVHCSGGSHKVWLKIAGQLSRNYRIIAPDLFGYGESPDWPGWRTSGLNSDIRLLEELIDYAGGDVHLVGHSYGGMLCLEAARRLAEARDQDRACRRVLSLCLIEPVSYQLIRLTHHREDWARIMRLTGQLVEAVEQGKLRKAAAINMSHWLGWLNWRIAAPKLRRQIVRDIPKVVNNIWAVVTDDHDVETYGAIDSPTTVIMGDRCHPNSVLVYQIMRTLMKDVSSETIKNGGHMSPYTHSTRVGELIQTHFSRLAVQ